jgi:hypothetical protein
MLMTAMTMRRMTTLATTAMAQWSTTLTMMVTAQWAVDHDGNGIAYNDINDNCDGAMGKEVDDNGNGVKLSSPSMRRRLSRCCNSVFALVMMALLPSPMRRYLAVVN